MASKNIWGSKLTFNGSIATDKPGSVRTEYDPTDKCYKTYRFVKATSSVDIYNGICLTTPGGGTIVTDDISDGSRGLPVGVAIGRIDSNSYGWVQIGGIHQSVLLSAATAIDGQGVVLHTVNGCGAVVALGTAPTHRTLGFINTGGGSYSVLLNLVDTVGR